MGYCYTITTNGLEINLDSPKSWSDYFTLDLYKKENCRKHLLEEKIDEDNFYTDEVRAILKLNLNQNNDEIDKIFAENNKLFPKEFMQLNLDQQTLPLVLKLEMLKLFTLYSFFKIVPEKEVLTYLFKTYNCSLTAAQNDTLHVWNDVTLEDAYKYNKDAGKYEYKLVEFKNSSGNAVQLKIDNNPQQRTLQTDESILALKVNGQYVSFLPRLASVNGIGMMQSNMEVKYFDGRKQSWQTDTRTLNESGKQFFVQSKNCGLFSINVMGKITTCSSNELDNFAQNNGQCTWLTAKYQDYGGLFDGKYIGRTKINNWQDRDLLAVCLSATKKGLAVTTEQKVIDETGAEIETNANAVQIDACKDNYIILLQNGTIKSNCKEQNLNNVLAVCAGANGCYAATDGGIFYLTDKDPIKISSDICEELVCSNSPSGDVVYGIISGKDVKDRLLVCSKIKNNEWISTQNNLEAG